MLVVCLLSRNMAKTPASKKSPAPKITPEQKARSAALKARFKASSSAGTVAQRKAKKVAAAKEKAAPVWEKLEAAMQGKPKATSPANKKRARAAETAKLSSPPKRTKLTKPVVEKKRMSPTAWKEKVACGLISACI